MYQLNVNSIHLFMFIGIVFCVISVVVLKKIKLYNKKYDIFFCMIAIFFIQVGYALYTPYYIRQHDSRSFFNYENGGHFGYIGYIFFNNHLPIGSPIDFWCFYNPPLFHIISAIFIKLQNAIGISLEYCLENLQILSVLYTIIFNIFSYKILKEIGIKKSIFYVTTFIGMAPAIIIMSGSLNNDMLSIMLSTISIYYTIKWYKNGTLKNLIKIAFSISLAIMTKISAALIAICIAVVFCVKVIQNKDKLKQYIKYFSIFAIISLPIGLWYPIKNLILYNIPITYVQSVDLDNEANISKYSVFDRFFTIPSKDNLKNINITMTGDKVDYNIFLTTIKSFIIDENIDYESNYLLNMGINWIFYCVIILIICFIINIIYIIVNFKKINNNWIIFFALIFILEVFSYLKFCFDYPFTFTMNFRYIVPTLLCYSAFTGIACDNNKKLFVLNNSLITLFIFLSILIFTNLT